MFIRNVKLSVKIQSCPLDIVTERLREKVIPYKNFGNYVSFTKKFSFVVFKPSSNGLTHINITKVPHLGKSVKRSLKVIKKLLKTKIVSYKLDNIIATSDLGKKISLSKIAQTNDFKVLYNNERFPGLFIKFDEGTVILYHSGKVVIVGCKTVRRIEEITEWLSANI
jgi:TATA-box binding protein (TBP) (component of TFIID and TFIIIB)